MASDSETRFEGKISDLIDSKSGGPSPLQNVGDPDSGLSTPPKITPMSLIQFGSVSWTLKKFGP